MHGLQVISWLEQYLTTQDISVVVVTHDRAFMETVCTSVMELEAGEVTLHNFGGPGSYDRFRQVCTALSTGIHGDKRATRLTAVFGSHLYTGYLAPWA